MISSWPNSFQKSLNTKESWRVRKIEAKLMYLYFLFMRIILHYIPFYVKIPLLTCETLTSLGISVNSCLLTLSIIWKFFSVINSYSRNKIRYYLFIPIQSLPLQNFFKIAIAERLNRMWFWNEIKTTCTSMMNFSQNILLTVWVIFTSRK